MQEELLQFKIQKVWSLVDFPKGVRPIGIKWVLKNKKNERGIVIKNKARLVAQGHTHKEGIDYDEVFAPVARIKAIRLFLAYASFMGFTDPEYPTRVYKVEKAMYGLHQAPRAWYGTLSKYLLTNGFQRGMIDQTLFIRRQRGDFILVQVYIDDIIFGLTNPQLCREFEALMHEKFQMSAMGESLGKGWYWKDVGLYLYRSMIRSLMYLTASRPDIMFAVCACARHQVTPKECHLHEVKRIFQYLKGHPKLGLWYPKDSLFDLVAYSDSDYGGATQDCKSTSEGCQFLGRRLISWQCKKQTIVATSTTEAEYVAAAIKNPVYHSKTKHVEIRHHFIRDCLEKKLINVDHIHTDENVADLLTKPFDAGRFQCLVSEHNANFHPIVDFVEASPLRRNLKLQDKEGISSLPDTKLFENLTLMVLALKSQTRMSSVYKYQDPTSRNMALPPREQRHEWLRFETQGLNEINEGDAEPDITERLRMEHKGDDSDVLFMTFVWRELLGRGAQIDPKVPQDAHVDLKDGQPDRLQRVEEEVQRMSVSLDKQRVMIKGWISKHARYLAWLVAQMTKLMESRGMRYERFDGSIAPGTHLHFEQRRVRHGTDSVSTSAQ
nr:hypothetical protein [Tanacetum cinerariifolium]